MAVPAPPLSAGKEDEVVAVVDGDTVKLAGLGRCRLIGVNTPETVAPRQLEGGEPPDCFGREASALTKKLLPIGTKVKVEFDAEPMDKYQRSLVYLYRAQDGMFINGELVKEGVARQLTVAPNVRYVDFFKKLEKDAQSAGVGLWKACPAGSSRSASAVAAKAPAGSPPASLSGKSCKDFKTYEEAKAWFDTYFPVYGDVARLDGDKDGKPCERLLKTK